MPTVIGIIFFFAGTYCFLLNEDSLLGLLLVASIFEASSVLNIAERGLQPYYLISMFIIVRGLVNRLEGANARSTPEGLWLSIFGVIAVASAFVLPELFAGIPIYDPKIGIDEGLLIRPALQFGLNNVVQASFLFLSIATAFSIPVLKLSASTTHKWYLLGFYTLALIVLAQSICQLTGLTFPYDLLLNNPGYHLWEAAAESGGTRNPGTFSEPSLAGAVLAMYCVGFTAEYLDGKGGAGKAFLALLATGAVASSGSLLTLGVIAVLFLVNHSPLRFPWYLRVSHAKRLGYIVLLLIVPLVLALSFSGEYRETLLGLTVSKGDSSSFFNRTASDLYALQLLLETHGLGVGLGSSRTSAMLPGLLSNVGIAGVAALSVFVFRLFKDIPHEFAWFRWAASALFLNMVLVISDITFPVFWILVFVSIELYLCARCNLKPAASIQATS